MKKFLLAFVCLSVVLFASCNRNQQSVKSAKRSIGLAVSTMNNPFFVEMVNGAKAEAKELGYNLIVLDSQNDPARELTNVQSLCTSGVKVIMINPTDSDAVISSVEYANKNKIPVITLDRASNGGDVAAAVQSDNEKGGKLAGEFIKKKLGNKAVIAELEGIPELPLPAAGEKDSKKLLKD